MTNIFTMAEVELRAREVGFSSSNARIVAAISMCEAPYLINGVPHSNFDAIGDQALANTTWGYSYGGMQIRSLRVDKGTGRIRDEMRLLDPMFNLRAARQIKLDAGSFKPWSTFINGNYKAYLQDEFPPPPDGYVVKAGDTLSGITTRESAGKWTWQDLARFNGLHAPYTIYIGQILLKPTTQTGA